MIEDGRLAEARKLYNSAIFAGENDAVARAHRHLDSLEADLALAHGRLVHAESMNTREADPSELAAFERAAELFERTDDRRGLGEALFWIGTYHQVLRDDHDTALPQLERAYALATEAGDTITMSYAVRHLAFVDQAAGRAAQARERFEESVRLRREADFPAGVAAGTLALAELDWSEDRHDDAWRRLDEAETLARDCGAFGTLGWIDATRAEWTAE